MKEKEFNVGGKDFTGYLLSIAISKPKEQEAWRYCAIYLTTQSEIIAHTVRYEKGIEKESLVQIVTDFYELNHVSPAAMADAKVMKKFLDGENYPIGTWI